jgi:peptidoglycan/xylan/chitin deacetylase (PgdA/CDA1 family)
MDPREIEWTRPRLIAVGALGAALLAMIAIVVGAIAGGDGENKSTGEPAERPKARAPAAPAAPRQLGSPTARPEPFNPVPPARRKKPVPILMYHLVNDPPPDAKFPELYVSRSDFASQMKWLKRQGYTGVRLQQVYDFWKRGFPLPKRPVVISFDDGYSSVHDNALPYLRRFGWPGVLNLELQVLDRPEQGGMTKAMVNDLLRAGWEVDSHTVTHPDLTTLTPEQLRTELVDSRKQIRQLFGQPANFFCYPAGRYNPTVVAAVRSAGYLGATTVNPGNAGPDQLFRMNRVRVDRTDGLLGFQTKMTQLRNAGVAPALDSFGGPGGDTHQTG